MTIFFWLNLITLIKSIIVSSIIVSIFHWISSIFPNLCPSGAHPDNHWKQTSCSNASSRRRKTKTMGGFKAKISISHTLTKVSLCLIILCVLQICEVIRWILLLTQDWKKQFLRQGFQLHDTTNTKNIQIVKDDTRCNNRNIFEHYLILCKILQYIWIAIPCICIM